MVALVEVLVRAGLSVLITSHTHSAVDNLLLRLKEVGLKFLRLGTDARIHPQLHQYSESTLTQHCSSPEDLDKVFSEQVCACVHHCWSTIVSQLFHWICYVSANCRSNMPRCRTCYALKSKNIRHLLSG